MVLAITTTEISIKIGEVEFRKYSATPELIRETPQPLASLCKNMKI
jgi:hypothetical protein